MLYRLLLTGFDCSNAKVFLYGYNRSIILSLLENNIDIADLGWHYNDIERLKNWLPMDLKTRMDGSRYGNIFKGANNFFDMFHCFLKYTLF